MPARAGPSVSRRDREQQTQQPSMRPTVASTILRVRWCVCGGVSVMRSKIPHTHTHDRAHSREGITCMTSRIRQPRNRYGALLGCVRSRCGETQCW